MRSYITRGLLEWVWDPPWRNIRVLGEVRILGASAAAVVVLPLLSMLIVHIRNWTSTLATVAAKIDPSLSDWISSVAAQLELPLVLTLLFASAVFAGFAQVAYRLSCPSYIRFADSFDRFRQARPFALDELKNDFEQVLRSLDDNGNRALQREFYMGSGLRLSTKKENGNYEYEGHPIFVDTQVRISKQTDHVARFAAHVGGTLADLMKYPEVGGEIFNILLERRDRCRRAARHICSLCYYVAIGLVVWAIGTQFLSVFRVLTSAS